MHKHKQLKTKKKTKGKIWERFAFEERFGKDLERFGKIWVHGEYFYFFQLTLVCVPKKSNYRHTKTILHMCLKQIFHF